MQYHVSRVERSSLESHHCLFEFSGVTTKVGFEDLSCLTCVSLLCFQAVPENLEGRMVRSFRDLNAVKLASFWCTERDFVQLRKVSKNLHRTFDYVPDEVVLQRTEMQHAGYFARMVALQWVRRWTQCAP